MRRDSVYASRDGQTIAELDLRFQDDSNQEEYSAANDTHDLMEGGSEIAVTEENKMQYLQLFAEHRLVKAIHPQICAFREGLSVVLNPVVRHGLRKCCTPVELQVRFPLSLSNAISFHCIAHRPDWVRRCSCSCVEHPRLMSLTGWITLAMSIAIALQISSYGFGRLAGHCSLAHQSN